MKLTLRVITESEQYPRPDLNCTTLTRHLPPSLAPCPGPGLP